MPRINGWYKSRGDFPSAPTVQAIVYLPRLDVVEKVDFLVDTGADTSVLMPSDVGALGLEYSDLDEETYNVSSGVGGEAGFYQEPAIIYFGQTGVVQYWTTQIGICDVWEDSEEEEEVVEGGKSEDEEEEEESSMPSLLGRDFLNLCALTADPVSGQFFLDPYQVESDGNIVSPPNGP